MSNRFAMRFVAEAQHIDMLGHVNNAVWVQWMEAIATAHWEADARPQDRDAYVWMVVRHEIDYRGNIRKGDTALAETIIPEGPRGARFDRHVVFRDESDKVLVRARSTWAMIERASGRLMRVPPEVAAPFLATG